MGSFFHDRLKNLPTYEELPRQEGLPEGCTWGLWDSPGKKDELGTLNFLTPEVVKEASKEVKAGISVALSWSMNKPNAPGFHRKGLEHTVIDYSKTTDYLFFDDELKFNSQCSSQWDGFRHHSHFKGEFYNDFKREEFASSDVLGIDKWSERGGIVGRGVLIDYVAFAQRHNIKYSPIETHTITPAELEQAAKEQNVEFKQGDILLVRSGFTKWYNEIEDIAERDRITSTGFNFVGVTATEESIPWVWNHHFAAVAGDAPTWESLPPPASGLLFHDYLLSFWGTPLGEFWDLEKLAETCAKTERYSFFFTSAPLNVPGGVASPPNALAIL